MTGIAKQAVENQRVVYLYKSCSAGNTAQHSATSPNLIIIKIEESKFRFNGGTAVYGTTYGLLLS
jgi:hypothetical protein